MVISILIPAYSRPEQLGQALQSIAQQDRSVIGEIIVGDDSPRRFWENNQEVIAASGLAELVEYIPSEPSRGTYPNQWFLASRAKCDHLLFLHNDQLCPGALSLLTRACANEMDPQVKLWFGTHLIMDESGAVDTSLSEASDLRYGRKGAEATRPMWAWCLTESIPSNAFLVERASYLTHMRGERDGNVGDWGFAVRLANSGAYAHFVGRCVSRYRVQAGSVTTSGRGVDAHRAFKLAHELRVPSEFEDVKRRRFYQNILVVAVRYARDGDRLNAWRSFLSADVPWSQRLSVRAALVMLMLAAPRPLWLWALRYKE